MNWKFWEKKSKTEVEKKPKSALREWWDAVLFAVVAANANSLADYGGLHNPYTFYGKFHAGG
jgi:hypothetical protein